MCDYSSYLGERVVGSKYVHGEINAVKGTFYGVLKK